jgi:hypothetical protein
MMLTGDGGELDARGVAGGRAPPTEPYDLAVVGREQALTGSVNRALRSQVASVDVGCTAENASVDAEWVA